MKNYEFVEIYQELSSNDIDIIDSRLSDIAVLEERRDDLQEKIDALPKDEREALNEEQNNFLNEASKEVSELEGAAYAASDADEEDMHRQSNILDADRHTYEHVTSHYPIGIEWLNRDIAAAREEIQGIVQAATERRGD